MKRIRHRTFWYGVLAAILLLLAAAGGYTMYVRSPLYAVKDAADAFRTHDLPRFEQRVDIPQVVDGAFEDIFAPTAESGPAARLVYALKPMLTSGMEMMLREQVAPTSLAPRIALPSLLTPSETESPADYEATDISSDEAAGGEATVTVTLRHRLRDVYVPLRLALRKDSTGYWRIVRLTNAAEVYRLIAPFSVGTPTATPPTA